MHFNPIKSCQNVFWIGIHQAILRVVLTHILTSDRKPNFFCLSLCVTIVQSNIVLEVKD